MTPFFCVLVPVRVEELGEPGKIDSTFKKDPGPVDAEKNPNLKKGYSPVVLLLFLSLFILFFVNDVVNCHVPPCFP